jgi:type VI secretion system protein ImpE
MNAEDLLREGRLQDAIAAVGSVLRDDPLNSRQRTFLFELLCFAGEYKRAAKQLDILASESQDAMLGAINYQSALNAETTREKMFEERNFPLSAGSAPSTAPVSGWINGRRFESISDADERIGARLEVFAAGDYLWISFRDVTALQMEAPKRLRDTLWVPIRLRTGPALRDRELGQALMPAIYPLSWQHPDDPVRLGRVTEWCRDENGYEAPFGQKMLLVDGEEFPILELRTLEIHAAAASA